MKNPIEIRDQCDVLIAKHKQAIAELLLLRRKADKYVRYVYRTETDAWGRPIVVRKKSSDSDEKI